MLAAWQCLAALSNRGIKATKPHCRCDFGRGSQEIPGSRHLSHQNHVRLSLVYADPCCTLYILKSENDRHASSILSRSKSVHGYFFTTTSTTKPGTPQSRLKLGPQGGAQLYRTHCMARSGAQMSYDELAEVSMASRIAPQISQIGPDGLGLSCGASLLARRNGNESMVQ